MKSKILFQCLIVIGFVSFLYSLHQSILAMLQASDQVSQWLTIAIAGLFVSAISFIFYKL